MRKKTLAVPMNTPLSTRWFGLLCAAALSSCANQSDSARIPVSATLNAEIIPVSRSGHTLTDRIFDEVNSYRRSQGLKEVQRHAGLDRLAQSHSEYLRQNRGKFSLHGKNVSHYGFEGRAMDARQNLGMLSVSENVAAANYPGQSAPGVLLELWRNSRDHHHNMTEKWTHSGIGVVVDSDGMVFATQLFATRNHSQLAMRERMNSF
jgi:uncharacterized protein YkwD